MKLTITTLVIVEGSYIQGIFHSLEEHPGKAYQELVDQVENEYGYDADKDHVPLHFKTIQDIKNYFELVHIETQELTINYRTEQIRDYLRYPGEELIPEHLHMINALKEIQNYWNLTSEKVIITDIIPIPQP